MVRTPEEEQRLKDKIVAVFRSGGLPKPVTPEWLEVAGSAGLVRKQDLKDGAYYYGTCRNARVARWDVKKNQFTYMRTKFGSSFPEDIRHPEDDDGFDLFLPVEEVQPEEREVIRGE